MRTLRSLAALAGFALAGCGVIAGACTDDLGMRLSPKEQTLLVGESFTPRVTLYGCGGSERLSDRILWSADDTTVVRVVPETGHTTALAPGQTLLWPTGERYGRIAAVTVVVRSRS